ncbi:unnamed protein product [Trichogramma brassicae]|uniref:LIM zinc-binding domain-containing protein n=1 Tax=Trichogramma brassicae TaxID=86971 RepID=A0A6H5ICV2_9HYME|nr:unnamed protein product [Trichogramma brassicae]
MDRTMYGKVEPGYSYQPYRVTLQKNGLAPGYALLADLQNTVSTDSSLLNNSGSTPGYGSINGTRQQHQHQQREQQHLHNNASPSSYKTYENCATPPPMSSQSPTYQNREAIEEARISVNNVAGHGRHYPHPSGAASTSTGSSSKMPSLNNNLTELDTLLQDLSNARYNSYPQERDVRDGVTNGVRRSPMLRSTSSLSPSGPTVDSLLEELATGMPNGDYSNGGQRMKVTIQETSMDLQPTGPMDSYYPPSHQGSLSRRGSEQQHGYSNGHHTASNATRELDDLMASLSEFKMNQQPPPPTTSLQQRSSESSGGIRHQQSHTSNSCGSSPLPGNEQTTTTTCSRVYVQETRQQGHPQYIPAHYESNHLVHQQHQQQQQQQQQQQYYQRNQLDSMLGNLQADMSRQGVNTTQKGCCSACEKPIVGQVITALGKTWHPEHFTCTHCREELGTRNFFEREGKPYCENDYHNLFSPRCAYCNGPILDKCVTALEKTWHTEHFFCAQCGKQFGEEGFHERDGKPYCRDDYFDMFAPKCGGCNRAIMENYISALNSQWHPECFVCRDCRQKFQGGSFFDHEGQPYCETHYHAKRGSLCAGCHKPITGRCITAMFRKFHPEHFVCAFCLKQLNKGTFKEQNDKPYCHGCFDKLFG